MKHYERIVKRFYDELADGRILGRKCERCGAVEFPPVIACNSCSYPEMEWVEMGGGAEITELVAPSMMSTQPENEAYRPYMFGVAVLDEGSEMNAIVRGLDPERADEFKAKLPLRAHLTIEPVEDYHTVIFDLDEGQL